MAELKHGTEVPLNELPQMVGEAELQVARQSEVAKQDPFGNSRQVTVSKPVNITQLQDEISEATGVTVTLSLMWPPGEEKGILHISPGGGLDGRTIAGKIRSHQPDPLYGLTDEEKAQAEVMEKVRRKQSLTNEEMTMALAALAGRRS